MRRISYYAKEVTDGEGNRRWAPMTRIEWPNQDQKINKPLEWQIGFSRPTEAEALDVCADNAAWEEIVAAESGAKTEIIHPGRRQS